MIPMTMLFEQMNSQLAHTITKDDLTLKQFRHTNSQLMHMTMKYDFNKDTVHLYMFIVYMTRKYDCNVDIDGAYMNSQLHI